MIRNPKSIAMFIYNFNVDDKSYFKSGLLLAVIKPRFNQTINPHALLLDADFENGIPKALFTLEKAQGVHPKYS